jgi:hypothetical protein
MGNISSTRKKRRRIAGNIMTAVNINILEQGCKNSGRQFVVASNILVPVIVQISCQVSGHYNSETADRFMGNLCTPELQ